MAKFVFKKFPLKIIFDLIRSFSVSDWKTESCEPELWGDNFWSTDHWSNW